jgi:hypothetical protein
MKSKILSLLIITLFAVSNLSGQVSSTKASPVGKWKFEAPYAPEGYTTGIINVTFAENKYSAAISFTGTDYIIPGDKAKVENDTLSFVVMVEGNEVNISIKPESGTKMTGKAVYFEGEVPLTLTKDVPVK